MRPLFLAFFALGVFALAGCLTNRTQEEYASAPRGSQSMYPLSTQGGYSTAPLAGTGDPSVYPEPAFGGVSTGGAYCEVEDTSRASPIVPVADPPIMVDNVIYAGTGPVSQPVYSTPITTAPAVNYQYQTPAVRQEAPERRPDGRPLTFAERRMARGSPYDPILRGTPYTYSPPAPTYDPQTQPVATYAPVQTRTYAPPAQPQPVVTYTPTNTFPTTPMVAQYPGQVVTTPGSSTVIRGNTVILPDPPMVIRDQSGRIETIGLSNATTIPLVRVPSQYAPGASNTAIPAAPPINPQIVTTAPAVSIPVQSGALYAAAPATYATSALQLVPATDIPPGDHPNDAAPSQWFEIVRPDNGPIRIGRVSSTCVCVSVRVPNRFVAAGERALIEARTVSRPSVNGLTYGIYVAVLEPVSTTLDADIVVSARR